MKKIDRVIEYFRSLREDAGIVPTNNVSQGNIAGTKEAGDDPPVRKRRRYMKGPGRKVWLDFLRNK